MLKELIHEKINEVFLEYQQKHGITSGDIDPWDAQRLERIEDSLADLIEYVCSYQKKEIKFDKLAPSWYIYTDAEGTAHSETFGSIDMDIFFCKVSKRIAFDDLSNETVQKIYFRGKEVQYAGWKPGMRFEYQDLDGNTIWVGDFPEWDH